MSADDESVLPSRLSQKPVGQSASGEILFTLDLYREAVGSR